MKGYRSTREFAAAVCKDNGQRRPKETWYLIEHELDGLVIQRTAPRSYDRVKRVFFCVNGERLVEKKFGIWVEGARAKDEEWLKQRLLRETLGKLRANVQDGLLVAPYSLDKELWKTLDGFITTAKWCCADKEFNAKVLDHTLKSMEHDGCFRTLELLGDPLKQAVA
jgi:hypothetical protein